MDYGYSRCSTNETRQDINRQVRELKQAGAVEIFMEYEHGDAKVKSQQAQMFAQAQPGGGLFASIQSVYHPCPQGTDTLDCREGRADPMSEAFLQMAGVFSQLELAMIRARVRSGMANAAAKGARIGRPQITVDNLPSGFLRHYPAYKSGRLNISELARVCDLSRTTIYKYIDLLEG